VEEANEALAKIEKEEQNSKMPLGMPFGVQHPYQIGKFLIDRYCYSF